MSCCLWRLIIFDVLVLIEIELLVIETKCCAKFITLLSILPEKIVNYSERPLLTWNSFNLSPEKTRCNKLFRATWILFSDQNNVETQRQFRRRFWRYFQLHRRVLYGDKPNNISMWINRKCLAIIYAPESFFGKFFLFLPLICNWVLSVSLFIKG